jgi:hypothetical protein
MITHEQYMKRNDSGFGSHRAYYSQFVNEQVKNEVLRFIGKEALLTSTDEHLNDIPLRKWDALGGFAFKGSEMIRRPTSIEPVDINLLREAGEGVSAATMVCIYKEAARQIIEGK